MRAPYRPSLWAGPIVYWISLFGTLLLANERARPWAVLLLIAAAMMAMALWGRQKWSPAFAPDVATRTGVSHSQNLHLLGLATAFVFVLAADLR